MAWKLSSPCLTHGSKSTPMERMLRMIWSGDSSKAKYRQRSPRRQAAWAKGGHAGLAGAGRAGHQDAAAPKIPPPPSIASSRGMPLEIRSSLASCGSPAT